MKNYRNYTLKKYLEEATNMSKAKQQAFIDMQKEGISLSFFAYEKAIIEFTATEDSIRIDFRVNNGGHNKKHTK